MNKRTTGVLVACFFTVLILFVIRYSYGTLLPDMLSPLSMNNAQAGVIYSAYFIAYTVLSPIIGILTDRYNIRIIMTIFITLMAGGTFLMQYSTSALQAIIFFTMAGIGSAVCWTPVMTIAQRWSSDKRRGMNLAFVDIGGSLGVIAAGSLVPLIAANFNWRTAWMSLGFMALILVALDHILIRSSPALDSSYAVDRYSKQLDEIKYEQIIKNRNFWFIGVAYLLTGFSTIIPYTFVSTYAMQEHSFSYGAASLLITTIGFAGIVGKVFLGSLSDKVGRIRILILCAFLIAIGCLGMAYSSGRYLSVFVAIFGIGDGACWSMYAASVSDLFPKKAVGRIIGSWTFLMGIGCLTAPIVAGLIADTYNTFIWSFILATSCSCVSLMLLLPLLKLPVIIHVKSG